MDEQILNTTIDTNVSILNPIIEASYQLEPMDKYEVVQLAQHINEQLGKDLFTDLHYPVLIKNFSIVSRALQLKSKQ